MYQLPLTWALAPCLLFAVAAGTTGSTTEPVGDGAYADYDGEGTVGFSIYNGVVPRWNAHDIPNLERCLAEHAPNVDLITADPQGDAAQQTSQVQSMLLDGIDVLLMTPVALTPTTIVEAAKEADVPIVGYLNPPAGLAEGDFVALVGDGPEPIGIAQAEWLLDNVEDGANVALVNGDLATQYAVLMRDGQLSVLQPAIDDGAIELVADAGAVNWDPANSQSEAAAILVANPDIDAFIVGNDQLANGVIQALKNVGREGEVKVVALDANPIGAQDMLQGWLTATVVKSFAEEMDLACKAILHLLNGEEIPAELFPDVWDFDTAPMPFRDITVEVIEVDGLQKAIDIGYLTLEEMCEGLPATVGPPCG